MGLVSIAEAILWGEQRYGVFTDLESAIVSIAEAILWGEQLCHVFARTRHE